jgi:hypothetical protein
MADQAIDLAPEGRKSNQVNRTKQPKKPTPGIIVCWPANSFLAPPPEHFRDNRGKSTMPGNNSVPEPGHHRIARKMQITPERQTAPRLRPIAKHPANGFRTATDFSIRFNQADSRLKTFDWNI